MTDGRPRQLARGLSALAGLVVLVAGVPTALVVLAGWPLPHTLPSVDAVRQALEQGWSPDGTVVLKALAVVCWVAWAELAVCVVVEVAAARRGRRPASVPLAGPLQPLVAHLVAVVLVSLGPAAPTGSLAPSAPPLTAAVARYGTPAPALRLTGAEMPPKTMVSASSASPEAAAPKQVVVRPRDNLWDLAERHLGNPLRWREIWELNRSRFQPDGRPLINPDLIRSGWTLLLPPDALDADTDVLPSADHQGPSLLAAPSPVTSPGDLRAPPPVPHGRPGAAELSPAPDPGTEPVPGPDLESRPPVVPAPVRLPSGSTVAASFAAGVAAAVATGRLRRRRAWRPSRPGPAVLTPPPDLGPAVRTILRGATPPQTAELGTTGANSVEPPPLFPYAGLDDPAPARLPISARGSRPVELELTGLGGLGVDGPGASDVVRALVAALLAKGRAYVTGLIVPAPTAQRLLPGAPAVAGVRMTPDLDAALVEAEVELVRRTRLLAVQEAADFAVFRQACPEDLLPALVIVTDEVSDVGSTRMRAVAELGARLGVGVIVCGAEGWCPTRIHVDERGVARDVVPEPLAAALSGAVLHRLTDAECAEVLGVLAVARTEEPVAPEGTTDAGEQGGEGSATSDAVVAEFPEAPVAAVPDQVHSPMPRAGSAVRVQLLGPYRIEAGGDELRTGLRSAARELLAFYLLRPEGAGIEAAVDAFWPEVELSRGSERFWTALGNLRSRVRQATGIDQPLIEKVGERYRVQSGVFDVDLWRFQEALVEAGRRLPDAAAEAALTCAARAYGGDLLEGSFYEWAEPGRHELRRRALDALARLADVRAGRGDKEGELAAVEQAIGVDPYAEEPYRRAIVLLQELDRVDVARQLFRQLGARLADIDADPEEETLRVLR